MNETLESLEDHDMRRRREICERMRQTPVRNGIACPKCGHELLDSRPNEQFMSAPPQMAVHCPQPGCGYKGLRVA